ncbi:MAG: radical SAM protein [Ruminococcus sp.]|nr:radical SAM protein [Ruminococcus sp.]
MNNISCLCCPRKCRTDRNINKGFCGFTNEIYASKAVLHKWEENCICGGNGAGAVFFSGCNLKCVYCQNYSISTDNYGKPVTIERLADIFLELQNEGASNIDLVTPTHFVYEIIKALDLVKHKLNIPVIYNCGGYELLSVIRDLNGYIDIYLPDLKYYDNSVALKYSGVSDYFEFASAAVLEMIKQTGKPQFDGEMLKKGTIIRHLVIPTLRKDSIKIMEWINENIPADSFLISLMSQYTPNENVRKNYTEINRLITKMEYYSVVNKAVDYGFKGYMQDKTSAKSDYTPIFDLSGL